MRRSVVLVVVAVIGLLLASAVPAGGSPADKTEYFGVECFSIDLSEAKVWEAGKTLHIRGAIGTADEWVWDDVGEEWVSAGENRTTVNANFGPRGFQVWGTFTISWDGIGDFEGTWSGDKATGKEVDGKRLVKINLAPDESDFPVGALPLAPDFCGPLGEFDEPAEPYSFVVIDPQGG